MDRSLIANVVCGENNKIQGFVENLRNKRTMAFLVIRDYSGRLQVTIEKEKHPDLAAIVDQLTVESVVTCVGPVVENEYVKMGGKEMLPEEMEILSVAEPLPLTKDAAIDSRMDYRWIDLRSDKNTLIFKAQTELVNAMREFCLNQDFLAFAKLSIDRPLHVRFIEYMPVGESTGADGTGWGKADVVPSEELLQIINERARAQGMPELVPAGNDDKPIGWGPARYFEFPGAKGTVGFISPLSRHFCSECNRLRLTADGKLRPCLFSDRELDVRAALREGGEDAVHDCFLQALNLKPDEHHDKVGTERKMSQIGG